MYAQITPEERYRIAEMLHHRMSIRSIAEALQRSPSTVSRELSRNRSPYDGAYRAQRAIDQTNGRRRRSRRNTHFSEEEWRIVVELLERKWSPEQISGRLRRDGVLSISHATIYARIKRDKKSGGKLWMHLRQWRKKRRKGYARDDSRGRPAGKKRICDRPASVENRCEFGHWEADTIKGNSQGAHTIVTMVERATGYTLLGKLTRHCAAETTGCLIAMIRSQGGRIKTITADNGSEFHYFAEVERATGVQMYFATPHHSWERGTNENTNGLLRQYFPKGESLTDVGSAECERVMECLNTRPRKRYGYETPEERYGSIN
jgi:transposase, IS30 family